MWDDLHVFRTVVDEGSFRRAADRLGIARSSVSRAVAQLEARVGVALLHRTTRQVAPTAEGAALHARVAPLLGGLQQAVDAIPTPGDAPQGTLRLTTTEDYGAIVLAPIVAAYAARYPQVEVETVLTNRVVDLMAERLDAAIRFSVRSLPGAGRAQRIGSLTAGLYAAPSYLARHGTPSSLDDLHQHVLVGYPSLLEGLTGIRPRVRSDAMQFVLATLVAGGGIGPLASFLAAPDVARGALVRVLPGCSDDVGALWWVVPGDGPVPARVSAFRAMLVASLSPETPPSG